MRHRCFAIALAFACSSSLLISCSSDKASDTAAAGASDSAVVANESAAAESPSPETAAPGDGAAAAAKDLCTAVPDPAAIEAAIGVGVKDPLSVGDPGEQQTCTFLRATDDFPGVVFTIAPGATVEGKAKFIKTNFNIDVVPLDGAEGYFAGEGNSVYAERNGSLYQTSASIDGDSRAASKRLMTTWLAMS